MLPSAPPPPGSEPGLTVRPLPDGEEITVRPVGWLRLLFAAFLAAWLCGWAAGEVIAAALLLGPFVRGPLGGLFPELARRLPDASVPWPVLVFLGVWLAFWTYGGAATVATLARLLAGRDVFRIGPRGFTVWRGVGPFGTTRRVGRGEALDIAIRRQGGSLILHGHGRPFLLARGGPPAAMEWLRDRLRTAAGLAEAPPPPRATHGVEESEPPLPADWEASPLPGGGVALGKSAADARKGVGCLAVVTLLWGCGATLLFLRAGPMEEITLAALAGRGLLLASVLFPLALTAWTALVRDEWHASPGRLLWIRRAGGRTLRELAFPVAHLAVSFSKDSDGDEWFELAVSAGAARKRVEREMNRATDVVALARFLSWATRRPLDLPPEALGD